MSHNSSNQIIIKPVITEKALQDRDFFRYHFWVALHANKAQIAKNFSQIFSVPVLSVRTLILKGKQKTDWKKRQLFCQPKRKKAIICLAKDQTIKILSIKK
ncbi:50S ribosomal protein L23 [Patescibacteria group bacterium]|nr:50S ribosomal protein L23 [Patescibacteria group bacterium]